MVRSARNCLLKCPYSSICLSVFSVPAPASFAEYRRSVRARAATIPAATAGFSAAQGRDSAGQRASGQPYLNNYAPPPYPIEPTPSSTQLSNARHQSLSSIVVVTTRPGTRGFQINATSTAAGISASPNSQVISSPPRSMSPLGMTPNLHHHHIHNVVIAANDSNSTSQERLLGHSSSRGSPPSYCLERDPSPSSSALNNDPPPPYPGIDENYPIVASLPPPPSYDDINK